MEAPLNISAVKTPGYDPEALAAAVARHFAALEADALFAPGVRVALKPNLLMKRPPEGGTTTHPALVTAVTGHLRSLGVTDITIADSPGGPYTASALEGIYAVCGMADSAARTGATLNRDTGWQTVASPSPGSLCGTFNILNPILEADVVINLPKLKTHAMTTLSGGVKNLLGCVPGLQKPELHFRFPQRDLFGRMLVELAETVAPQLTIIDAVVAMEGDGPSAGTLRELGWTFASRSPFALDEILCRVMGLDPLTVPTVAYARKRGLAAPDALTVTGDGLPRDVPPFALPLSRSVTFRDSLPGPLRGLADLAGSRLLSPRPVVSREGCTGCGRCTESCPAHVIAVTGRKAVIEYKDCIKCYCCHEMCPVKAIHIRKARLLEH